MFIENRVQEIRKVYPNIKYCPTKDNPADLLTRGTTAQQLASSKLWWKGPEWLSLGDWPTCELLDEIPDVTSLEHHATHDSCDVSVYTASSTTVTHPVNIEKYNSLACLVHITAYVLRFITRLKQSQGNQTDLTVQETHNAKLSLVKSVQAKMFANELECLRTNRKNVLVRQLKLFVDDYGVLRCGGRFQNANLNYDQKFPMLLPTKHHLTKLIVLESHALMLHSGVNGTITHIRQTYWICKIRQVVRSILRACRRCLTIIGKPYPMPPIPPLPSCRIQETPPFTVTGVDFTGTLYYKTSESKLNKAYVCLFICAITCAIHLELVTDMTTVAFIYAFRRFSSRRSLPSHMISDNGTTFISACKTIQDIFNDPSVKSHLNNRNIQWSFIPKRAPWFGGFYERLIGITKTTLRKVLGRTSVTLDELTTLLIEVEAVINDRPITYVNNDVNEITPLTPSHLINGRMMTLLPHKLVVQSDIVDPDFMLLDQSDYDKRALYVNRLFDDFWKRWRTEYLPALRENHINNLTKRKCSTSEIKEGDIVLVHQDNTNRTIWPLAMVKKLNYGNDNNVRSAEIKTKTGVTNRPISKLYPLEVNTSVDHADVNKKENNDSCTNDTSIKRPTRKAALKAKDNLKAWAKIDAQRLN